MKFDPTMVEKILAGTKTQARLRGDSSTTICAGDVTDVERSNDGKVVGRIRVSDVFPQRLGSVDMNQARAEGFDTVAAFLNFWRKAYSDGFYDPSQIITTIEFDLLKEEDNGG